MVTAWKGEDATQEVSFFIVLLSSAAPGQCLYHFSFLILLYSTVPRGGGGNSMEMGHICALCVLNLLFLCDLYVNSKSSRYSQILTVHSAEVFFSPHDSVTPTRAAA